MNPVHLLCDPEKVARTVLLPGDPKRAEWIADFFDNAEKVAHNREFLIFTGTYKDVPVSVCSTGIGSPSAVIALEELIMCGANTFIRVGTCGGLQEDIEIGDLVIPLASCRGEGTSSRYAPLEFPAVAHPDVVASLKKAAPQAHVGVIWTDDSFYCSRAQHWHSLGILAVEMECASLFVVSMQKKVRTGALLAVDGNIILGTCKSHRRVTHTELPQETTAGIEKEIKAALEAVVYVSQE
ncbi:MAG: nucleoside phosphorylase [Theionarchaea archaeon]|nr:nucleoside phosphorylase [Theionarchaea archaeon]MBU6999753.1 nucleoside phosphorylase [Theionarchaea archaeon]MBU7020174.1 nucleoside phosphorylase [Theionarchaea archaeon]MBU7033709.1 nucleoside phosphorylase [Theionarchaea archaeon]MBU7039980.1 nucleoside phosphorylase [Theionarchaea archaeon]